MLPRKYSASTVQKYLKRIKLAQRTELNIQSSLDSATATLIATHADAVGCSREAILFPLLAAVAGCMGVDTDIVIDSDWSEKPNLWILVAGRRGDKKTPAINRVKNAVFGLEKDIQALFKTQNCVLANNSSNNAHISIPRILLHNQNFKEFGESLKTNQDKRSVIGIFDNFGSFLRSLNAVKEEFWFSDPEVLMALYDLDKNILSSSDQTFHSQQDYPQNLSVNFVGMIEAMDAVALFDEFDADGLTDRLLVACPKDLGWPRLHSRTNTESQGTAPTLQVILSTIRNYHQVQRVTYGFREDGLGEFHRCLAELDLWQQGFVDDERRRGVLAKAPGQLARLCAVITALQNGLSISYSSGAVQILPSTTISLDTVKMARSVLMYLISQKMALLPDDEVLGYVSEWEEMADGVRVEMNEDVVEETNDIHPMDADDGRNGGRIIQNKHSIVLSDDKSVSSIADDNSPENRNFASANKGTTLLCPDSPRISGENCSVKVENDRMVMSFSSNQTPMHSGELLFPGMAQGASLFATPVDEKYASDLRILQCQSLHSEVNDTPPRSSVRMRHSPDMFQITDEQLVETCAIKVKKLLLLPGMVIAAATICQKRLFPPVPKEMRVEHPRTSHPVWAAVFYLKRLAKLGLGELVHPIYRMQSIHFRKIRLECISPTARELLKKMGLSEEEYEESYPKYDDSYASTFIVIRDLEQIAITPR